MFLMPTIVWFRRDFRLADNTALSHAAADSADGIIPVFIFDDAILKHPDTGAPIVEFMLGCLRELDANLRKSGGRLLCLRGNPALQLLHLARQRRAGAVYYNKDYAPGAVERDVEVERVLGEAGVMVKGFKDQVIFEEQELLTASKGEPFTVYTPYRRAWEKLLAGMGAGWPEVLGVPKLRFPSRTGIPVDHPGKHPVRPLGQTFLSALDAVPTLDSLGFHLTQRFEITPGESAAHDRLRAFCSGPLRQYQEHRNTPALADSTSRLSPHLRHGTLSPRQCLRNAMQAKCDGGKPWAAGADTWIGELIWRDFYQQILFNFPQVQAEPFKEKWQRVRWRNSDADFQTWTQGRTGFPIVDAAMRQLTCTGWMHNRLRMIVANFLTRDLLIDYRLGERWFMQNLIDGETAQNNGGWQWSAGCGTDAQPYFRIFNPASQSQTCDPRGAFIRRYCPELAKVPDEFIHTPHEMPPRLQEQCHCRIGRDYPAPLVDHAAARQRALAAFAAVR